MIESSLDFDFGDFLEHRGIRRSRLAIMLGLLLGVALVCSCGSSKHISRYDPVMYQGLCDARTSLNTYLPDTLAIHRMDAQFYPAEFAKINTLLAQARSTPLNDSATIAWLTIADSDLVVLRYEDNAHVAYSHLIFFRDQVNADFDGAISLEKIKLNLPQ